jgi:hypothetical protein
VEGIVDELTRVRLGDLVAVKYGPEGAEAASGSSASKKLYPDVSRMRVWMFSLTNQTAFLSTCLKLLCSQV